MVFVVSFLVFSHAGEREWTIKRSPFVVSKNYIKKTGKGYLQPQDTYGSIDLEIKGVFYKEGAKNLLLDLKEKGYLYMREGQTKEIDTPDIETIIKVVKIADDYALISINDGEAIRHELH